MPSAAAGNVGGLPFPSAAFGQLGAAPSSPPPPPVHELAAEVATAEENGSNASFAAGVASPPAAKEALAARLEMQGRGLSESVVVDNVDDLVSAVAGSAAEVRLAAGVYNLSAQLQVARDVIITADVDGSSVVLDGQGSSRVLYISSGTVALVGLNITNGYDDGNGGGAYVGSGAVVSFSGCAIHDNTASYVSFCLAPFHGPHGSSFQELSPRARREVACTSTAAQPPSRAAPSTRTRPAGCAHATAPHSMAPMEDLSRN